MPSINASAVNALMFGSDEDTLYLAEYTPSLSAAVAALGIADPIPAGMVEAGWISDEGANLTFNDSVEKIRGHQGNAVVKTYMSSSDTGFEATLLESKLEFMKLYLDSTVTRLTAGATPYAKFANKSSRKVKRLVGIWDAYDTASGAHVRLTFPVLELGAREGIPFLMGEVSGMKFVLEVIGAWYDLVDAPALVPAAPGPLPTITGVTPPTATTGSTITVAGTNLTGTTSVNVGGAEATGIVVVSATSVTATMPAGTAGSVAVSVTTPNGTSQTFSYARGA